MCVRVRGTKNGKVGKNLSVVITTENLYVQGTIFYVAGLGIEANIKRLHVIPEHGWLQRVPLRFSSFLFFYFYYYFSVVLNKNIKGKTEYNSMLGISTLPVLDFLKVQLVY